MELIAPQKPKGFKKMSIVFGNGRNTNARNSREIYKYLDVKEKYARWIKRRIDQNGAEEEVDFFIISGDQKDTAKRGNFIGFDYIVTDDFAKHLGMLEKTAKGKEVRNYFIYMEKLARYLMQKMIAECQIKATLQNQTIKELSVKRMKTYKDGFMSLRKYLKDNDIKMTEETAWSMLGVKKVVENRDVWVSKKFLINETFGRQTGDTAIEFNSRALDVIFSDFIETEPSLF